MVEQRDNSKPGDDRHSFTQEEISQLVKYTEIGFDASTSYILSYGGKLINTLRSTVNGGRPLSFAATKVVYSVIEGIGIGTDVIKSQGDFDIAFAEEQALEGAEFLAVQIRIGEGCVLGNGHEMLSNAVTRHIEEESLTNEPIPLSEQEERYLRAERLGTRLASLYEHDSSGFTIVDKTLEALEDPSSDLYVGNQLDLTYKNFVLCGVKKAAEFYKQVYLLGCTANLGPKPKA